MTRSYATMQHRAALPTLDLSEQDFHLGTWLIQPAQCKIVGTGNTIVSIEPKMMQVLLCLAQHQGEVVSRDTLMETVWPDVVIVDDTLTRCISQLRKLFGETPGKPRLIETIRKRGYRLIMPVQPVSQRMQPSAAASNPQRRRKRYTWGSWAAAAGALCLLAYSLGWYSSTIQVSPSKGFVFLDSLETQQNLLEGSNQFHLSGKPVSPLEATLLLGKAGEDTVFVWHSDSPTASE